MIICGIDYSLTSPAICVHEGDTWNPESCTFHYIVNSQKKVFNTEKFKGVVYPDYNCEAQRYDNLSSWSTRILTDCGATRTFIEGYSYNSVGKVFQISENTGVLKYSLWKKNLKYFVFAPTAIKKFATTKGNANKEMMYACFLEETMIDIRKELEIKSLKQWNPLSDIVDSYYIAKMGFENTLTID
jgi:Holliday junction resolvasome RuvABC endonuclease subunit